MEPPAYTPATTSPPQRSIADLRAQIIANGSVMRARSDVHRASDDHIELIVAKTPAPRSTSSRNSRTHWSEKEALAALNRTSDPMRTTHSAPPGATPGVVRPAPAAGPSVAVTGVAGTGKKHYAVLVRRSGGRQINIMVQGEPRDTVEEALEWMLERTECLMHDLVVRNGRPDAGDGCVVM